ncbi:TolC family protein [Sphingobium sp. B11D3B]|uniref:TolC family protein n=1 Tax=Sphingobium sp. B11D3B TaxID=2940575 RepID=UPI002226B506|nr:TolC family protein [Sphingobium sp. B11D3B]
MFEGVGTRRAATLCRGLRGPAGRGGGLIGCAVLGAVLVAPLTAFAQQGDVRAPVAVAAAPGPVSEPSSLSLDDLMAQAARNNPQVLSQTDGARASAYEVASARWAYFPEPAFESERGRRGYVVTGTLTQPVWTFGRIGANVDAAKARLSSAEAAIDATRYQVALRVIDSYGRFVAARLGAQVYAADIARLEALEGMMRRRVATGLSAPVDHNLVLTRLSLSRNTLTNYQAIEQSAAEALSQLTGRPIDPARIAFDVAAGDEPLDVRSEDLLARTIETNPALLRAEQEIGVAKAEARVASRAMMPTIYARAEQRFADDKYYPSSLPDTRVVVGVKFAFGSGLASVERIRASQALESAARNARDAYRADLTAEVAADLASWRAARSLVRELQVSRGVQQQTFESYNRMFLAGKRSWLDVLNVTREQTDIERSLSDAQVQLLIARYRLRLKEGAFPWN